MAAAIFLPIALCASAVDTMKPDRPAPARIPSKAQG
jgi:hypothetical protein